MNNLTYFNYSYTCNEYLSLRLDQNVIVHG